MEDNKEYEELQKLYLESLKKNEDLVAESIREAEAKDKEIEGLKTKNDELFKVLMISKQGNDNPDKKEPAKEPLTYKNIKF